MQIRFEWDDDNAAKHFKKHGVSFGVAARVFADPFALMVQDRIENSEQRWQTIGMVEGHLLLSPTNRDTDGDGIPDNRDPMPNVAWKAQGGAAAQALSQVLQTLFSMRMGAIITGIDMPAGNDVMAAAVGRGIGDIVSINRPIFVHGNAARFAGLRPDRMMFVYSDEDIRRLQRMTPDFHAVWLQPLILNNAGDKAFVVWSAGWVGGAFRVTRHGAEWKVEVISSWIT